MKYNLNELLNPHHKAFFQSTDKELLFYGGAAGGKSYSVADKLLLQPVIQRRSLKLLVIRKSMPSLKRTCMSLMEKRAGILGIPTEINRADSTMSLPFDSKVYFLSIGHYVEIEKIKSITDADMAWIEEANELTEEAVSQTILRLRGGSGMYKQIILTFNPIGTTSWIYDRHFLKASRARKIKVTVDDNPWIETEYIAQLDALKDLNENMYRVYRLGEWGTLEGTIYKNWELVDAAPEKKDDTIYGLDFGFNNPTALIRIDICDQRPFLTEKIYQSFLTNNDLVARMHEMKIGDDLIYADPAEPARIEELRRAGFNVLPADKDVHAGISFCQNMKLYIVDESDELHKEVQSYSWQRDKDGKYIDKPVKFKDHGCDAFRYGLYTHMKKRFEFIKIGPDGAIGQKKGQPEGPGGESFGDMLLDLKRREKYRGHI